MPTPSQFSTRSMKFRVCFALCASFLILFIGFVSFEWFRANSQIRSTLKADITNVPVVLDTEMRAHAASMEAIAYILSQNTELTAAFLSGDRDRLFDLAEPLFHRFKTVHRIDHLCFNDKERINLLRVHERERHGDLADHYTMLAAERTGEASSGAELGPLGTFTVRAAVPWYDGDTLIGYLELGEEIEEILRDVSEEHAAEVAVTIRKSALQREQWEAGMRLLGRDANWSRLADDVCRERRLECAAVSLEAPNQCGQALSREVLHDQE